MMGAGDISQRDVGQMSLFFLNLIELQNTTKQAAPEQKKFRRPSASLG